MFVSLLHLFDILTIVHQPRPPKTGSSSMRIAFKNIFTENDKIEHFAQSFTNFNQINEMAGNKIFVIREPFFRLLSCYHDKFILSKKCNVKQYCGHTQFGPLIVNVSRPNATREELANGCPTFDEFVRFTAKFRNYHNFQVEFNFIKTVRKNCIYANQHAIQHW